MRSWQQDPVLRVEHLTMRFGGLVAVDDVSFVASRSDITAIIGPNGAGKTTVFNCLTGFYRPTVGRLTLAHERGEFLLERMEGFRIAQRARVARTFQNIRLFPKMTVLENLIVAQHNALMLASGYTVLGMFGAASYRHAEARALGAPYSTNGEVPLGLEVYRLRRQRPVDPPAQPVLLDLILDVDHLNPSILNKAASRLIPSSRISA